jgi:ABC-type branched-subunit amino acid transport system substrate-binding protein
MRARALRGIAIATVAVVAASCTTSSGDKAPVGSSPPAAGATAPGSTTPAPAFPAVATGVTNDTIKIGFSYPDLALLAKLGLLKVDNGPVDRMARALVDDVNAKGGINGRKLELVTAKYSVIDPADQLAACAKLTEDDKVFAVLGGFVSDDLCVVQQHATILISMYAGFNSVTHAKARAPWVSPNPIDERSIKALVQVLDQQGRLQGHKLAVYSPAGSNDLVKLTVDTLKRAGYSADSATNTVPVSDTTASRQSDLTIVQRFKDEGIDTVLIVGGSPVTANWDKIGWTPSTYLTSASLIGVSAYTNKLGNLPIVAGPAAAADPDAGYDTSAMQDCRAVYKRATGIDIQTNAEEQRTGKSTGFGGMISVCTAMQIFVQAAKNAGADLNQETWAQGLAKIGSIALPEAPTASFGPNKFDGQDSFVLQRFNPAWTSKSSRPEFITIGQAITVTG